MVSLFNLSVCVCVYVCVRARVLVNERKATLDRLVMPLNSLFSEAEKFYLSLPPMPFCGGSIHFMLHLCLFRFLPFRRPQSLHKDLNL